MKRMNTRQAMKLRYIYTLLTLLLALCFVPAVAQTGHKPKKHAAKVIRKKPAPKKPVKTAPVQQKANAQNLGDAAASTAADTIKKGGQPADLPGGLSQEIVVTTAYKPVLAEAVKIRINPDLEDKTPFKAPLSYTPIDKRLEDNTNVRPLIAMNRPAEVDTDRTNNYIKLGLGNLKTTYGEAYFNNGKDQALQVGGYLKHFMQSGNLTKQNSSKEEAGVFGKSVGAENSLSGRIDYNYNSNYFYGYDQKNPPPVLQLNKQHFSTIGAEGELVKNYKDVDNDFTYALKLKGYVFNNAYQAKENNLVLSGFLNQTIGQFYAGVSGSLDFATQKDSLYSLNNSLVRANPYLKFQGETYKIDAGVNLVDQFGTTSSFHIFPAAKLELQVIPKYVRLFAEVKGDVNRSSLLDFSQVNPFLGQNIPIKNSIDQLDITAGLKGTLTAGVSFKVAIFRNMVKDMPLFVSDFNFNGYNKFTVIYDDGQSRINGINAELDIKASESVDIYGRAEVKQYQMATFTQAWNLPKYKLTAGTVIHISDLIDVTGTLLFRGPAYDPHPAVDASISPTTINAFADLSGAIEYKASKKISIFVHVNNILNTNNQTWLYYPDYGFNIFGGAGFAF